MYFYVFFLLCFMLLSSVISREQISFYMSLKNSIEIHIYACLKYIEYFYEDISLFKNSLSLLVYDLHLYVTSRNFAEIENVFNDVGKFLKDFSSMPFPGDIFIQVLQNRLIAKELNYDKVHMLQQHEILQRNLNEDQLNVSNSVLDSVENNRGGLFFVYGSGGCCKMFLWNTLCCKLRSIGKIVLPVASFGIAATLLSEGRTSHSRFHIPLKLD